MSPELKQLLDDLRNASNDNIIQWQTRRRRWQAVMDMAANTLNAQELKIAAQDLELSDRRRAEAVRLQVKAMQRVR